MTQRRIEVVEYECERCGYKWMSRIEKPKPRCCAKCKHPEWDSPRMTWIEKGLRNRIRRMDAIYSGTKRKDIFGDTHVDNSSTCNRFLFTEPRPTEEELRFILRLYQDDVEFWKRLYCTNAQRRENEMMKKETVEAVMLEIINEREKNNIPAESAQVINKQEEATN